MSRPSDRKELTLFSKPPLLITKSEEEFASLSAALEQAIKPRCVVERIYVADIADLVWEILRLRRCKAAIINTAFEDALSALLNRLMGYLNSDSPESEERAALVSDWFWEPKAKKEISELLGQYHLDEFAIEAEAIRSLSEELEAFDRALTSLESRRNKALRCIADYQDRFATKVRQASDRMIEGKAVVQLENRSARRSA